MCCHWKGVNHDPCVTSALCSSDSTYDCLHHLGKATSNGLKSFIIHMHYIVCRSDRSGHVKQVRTWRSSSQQPNKGVASDSVACQLEMHSLLFLDSTWPLFNWSRIFVLGDYLDLDRGWRTKKNQNSAMYDKRFIKKNYMNFTMIDYLNYCTNPIRIQTYLFSPQNL